MRTLALMLLLCGSAAAQEEAAGDGRTRAIRMGGFLLFGNNRAPHSIVALPARPAGMTDAGEVKDRSCQWGVAIPLALNIRATSISASTGDGGYEKVMSRIKEKHPEVAGIYDARMDAHYTAILGIFRRLCLEVTARSFRL